MTIFVANFDGNTDESDLRTLFENFGTVNDVRIPSDWRTGEQLSYAFIEMPNDGEASDAIDKTGWKALERTISQSAKSKSGVPNTQLCNSDQLTQQRMERPELSVSARTLRGPASSLLDVDPATVITTRIAQSEAVVSLGG